MPDEDARSWFEQAFIARTMETAGDLPRILFRCTVCEALVEGQRRAAHRYWHLGLAGAK